MTRVIKKINILILNKSSFFFTSLFFLLLSVVLISQFFLFSSVSYVYAIKKESLYLDKLISNNMDKRVKIFKQEREVYKQEFGDKIVTVNKINYIKPVKIVKKY